MPSYVITVTALGYESTVTIVNALTMNEAKRSESKALRLWAIHNDVDLATCKLASLEIKRQSRLDW